MRFYDYKCSKCPNIKEYYENTNDSKKEHLCEDCSAVMNRVISTPDFRIKKGQKVILHSERRKKWNSGNPRDARELTF